MVLYETEEDGLRGEEVSELADSLRGGARWQDGENSVAESCLGTADERPGTVQCLSSWSD